MMRDRLHAEVALNIALKHGVFSENIPQTIFLPNAENALMEDLKTFQAWEEQLKAVCRREAEGEGPALFVDTHQMIRGKHTTASDVSSETWQDQQVNACRSHNRDL